MSAEAVTVASSGGVNASLTGPNSAVAISGYALASGRPDILVIRAGEARPIWSLGLLFVLQIALMNEGLERTTAAHGVIVLNSYAIHTVVFSHFMIPGDRLTARKLAASS